jgi:hypothetical protein
MLREIVIEEEMPGDFQTTFRLRVDGNLIAENMTELETQFLVSEMLERIPSLRVAASDDAEQPQSNSAALPLRGRWGAFSERAKQWGAVFYAQPPAAFSESSRGETQACPRDRVAERKDRRSGAGNCRRSSLNVSSLLCKCVAGLGWLWVRAPW